MGFIEPDEMERSARGECWCRSYCGELCCDSTYRCSIEGRLGVVDDTRRKVEMYIAVLRFSSTLDQLGENLKTKPSGFRG